MIFYNAAITSLSIAVTLLIGTVQLLKAGIALCSALPGRCSILWPESTLEYWVMQSPACSCDAIPKISSDTV